MLIYKEWIKIYDFTNKHVGFLQVISCCDDKKNGSSRWICDCDCGIKGVIKTAHCLIYGKNQSCGCYVKQLHSKENTYIRDNDTYIGKTQNGYEFIIDVDDYEKVSKYCWHQHNDGYLKQTK